MKQKKIIYPKYLKNKNKSKQKSKKKSQKEIIIKCLKKQKKLNLIKIIIY